MSSPAFAVLFQSAHGRCVYGTPYQTVSLMAVVSSTTGWPDTSIMPRGSCGAPGVAAVPDETPRAPVARFSTVPGAATNMPPGVTSVVLLVGDFTYAMPSIALTDPLTEYSAFKVSLTVPPTLDNKAERCCRVRRPYQGDGSLRPGSDTAMLYSSRGPVKLVMVLLFGKVVLPQGAVAVPFATLTDCCRSARHCSMFTTPS